MNPVEFPRYSAPQSLEEALRRAQEPGTTVLGGGTVVYPLLQRAWIDADELIDLFGLRDTRGITTAGDTTVLGAMTTYAELLQESRAPMPAILRVAAGGVTGGPQLRNQATIGGSACYANPASDIPTILVALHAELHLASSATGERHVSAAEFFLGPFATSRRTDEVLVAIIVPNDADGESWGHYKLKTSQSGWPIGVAAARLRRNPIGPGGSVAVTLGALTETPFELAPLELLDRRTVSPAEEAELRRAATAVDVRWWSDDLADSGYRGRVAGAVAVRAVVDALKEGTSNG